MRLFAPLSAFELDASDAQKYTKARSVPERAAQVLNLRSGPLLAPARRRRLPTSLSAPPSGQP